MNIFVPAGFALAFGGLAAISYTMDRHHKDIHGRSAEPDAKLSALLRLAGWLSLLLAFGACVAARGWHVGPVLCFGVLTVSAMVLTLLLQYTPRGAMRVAKGAYLALPVLALLSLFGPA